MKPLNFQVVGHFAGQNNFFSRLSLKVQHKYSGISSIFVDPILLSQGLHSREATHRVARVQRVLDRVCRRISLESAGQHPLEDHLEVEANSPHGVSESKRTFNLFTSYFPSR